jgi:enoyl-CoA hydratase/carnithine racemase
MGSATVTYACADGIAEIGLNRPDKRNALSQELLDSLADAAERAASEARVAILHGTGPNFCAGLDLAETLSWVSDPAARHRHIRASERSRRRFDEIARSPIPFIAAVTGACVGGGFELAAACHLRVADATAFFALPEGQRGIYIGGGGSVRISRLAGVSLMTDMMLTGRVLTAEDGERFGIVTYLVDRGGALEKARELAKQIGENEEAVNWAVVSALPRLRDLSYDDGLFAEALVIDSVMSRTGGSTERLKQFLDKRAKPLGTPAAGESSEKHEGQ